MILAIFLKDIPVPFLGISRNIHTMTNDTFKKYYIFIL